MIVGFFLALLPLYFLLYMWIRYYYTYKKEELTITKRHGLYQNSIVLIQTYEKMKEIAFDKTYKEQLFYLHKDNQRPNEDQLDIITGDYIKLVLVLCGDNIKNDLIELFGSLDTICLQIGSYFIANMLQLEEETLSSKAERGIISDGE